jgi:8-oxo-dGTP diphosphatase
MRTYVCGFLFSPDRANVLLIRKRRPAWQAGKLNGVGGKIEPGESPLEAMRREFREEAALDIPDWHEALTLTGPNDAGSGVAWRGHFFRAFASIDPARALTDEPLEIHPARRLPDDTIPNLRWMIPLLLDDEPLTGAYQLEIIASAV